MAARGEAALQRWADPSEDETPTNEVILESCTRCAEDIGVKESANSKQKGKGVAQSLGFECGYLSLPERLDNFKR